MRPAEIKQALNALAKRVGIRAEAFCHVDFRYGNPVSLSVYAYGMTCGNTFRVEGMEWAEVIEAANAKWDEMRDRFDAERIEAIALEIIRLTALHGTCTDAALRGDKYSDADLKQFGAAAIEKANAMAANGPFSIQLAAKANAA